MSKNVADAVNQQGSRPLNWIDPSETTRRAPFSEKVRKIKTLRKRVKIQSVPYGDIGNNMNKAWVAEAVHGSSPLKQYLFIVLGIDHC